MQKVIVVEDDNSIGDILQIILKRAGYEVTHYANGTDILNGNIETPDIFLIDRQLSGVDGLEICRHLKSQHSTAHVPIIVLSATPGILNVAKNAGADDFIEKPFTKANLIQKVQYYLKAAGARSDIP